ncbi:hypothetical protein [Parvularcula marina]|uniref:Sugar transporter n=1 Tax=Parvularcula marina TaxID=2292771 RepID=A0A371RKY5_9PROT|nr:hypothetical protein [Parvularcula marina]RFB06117.1 hypothetical protein DX908_13080 [Parvularcula marina]
MKTPWHIWVVGIFGVLWVGMGCFDYVMTATENEAYFSQIPEDQRAFFLSYPGWFMACYAIGVWGGLIGCILILLKRKLAVPLLLVSFATTVICFAWMLFIAEGRPEMVLWQQIFNAAVLIISLFLLLYSRRMAAAGVLR